MKALGNRLKEFIDYKGISVRKFEKEVGVTDGTFQKIIKNGTSTSPENIEKIFRANPKLSHRWLMSGEGNMMMNSNDKQLEGLEKENQELRKELSELKDKLINILLNQKK